MRKILRFHVLSFSGLFAVLYAIGGLFFAFRSVSQHTDKILCPLGLVLPFLQYTINLTLPSSVSWLWAVIASLTCVACYFITGGISGAVVAVAYNLTSRFWGGIKALPGKEEDRTARGLGLR